MLHRKFLTTTRQQDLDPMEFMGATDIKPVKQHEQKEVSKTNLGSCQQRPNSVKVLSGKKSSFCELSSK